LNHLFAQDRVASFLNVRPNLSFHVVNTNASGQVTTIEDIARSHLRVNGGYFAFRRDIFNYIGEGEELVEQPFQRLIAQDRLLAYTYDGFWQAMDTFKDRQRLEQLYADGHAPWEVWKTPDPHGGHGSVDVGAASTVSVSSVRR
jgi:glucose-1-phosphate cytidylyltransferase